MYMVKKKKSVERTKDKNVLVSNNNKNTNTQITQIIFPADMEIRTKRKKRKGKSKAQKKKEEMKEQLLEMLKSKLNEYDNIQQLLQQKKIPIPNELALTVINQEDLKTNEDIESYIDNVSKKISILNELLNKPVNPFSIRGSPFPRLGSGVIQQPTLPPLINPSLIPRPQPQPSTDIIPRQEPNNEEPETNRQSQAELEKIKKELEDEVGEKELPLKYEELKEGDLINTELKIGDKYVKFKVPNGFEELFNFYRKYIQDLEYITGKNQIMKGVYHIPIQKYNQLIKDRDSLKEKYRVWINELPNRLRYYVEKTNRDLSALNIDIFNNLQLEPKDFVKDLFKGKVQFTEITQGNEKPQIENKIQNSKFKDEKDEKVRNDYENFIAEMSGKITIIRDKITKSNGNKQKLDQLGTELNLLGSQLESKYNDLPYQVQLSVITEYQSWEERLNQVRKEISDNIGQINPIVVNTKLTPEQIEAKKVLRKYISSPPTKKKNITPTIKVNIRTYFGNEKGNEIIDVLEKIKGPGKEKTKKDRLRDYLNGNIEAEKVDNMRRMII